VAFITYLSALVTFEFLFDYFLGVYHYFYFRDNQFKLRFNFYKVND